MVAKNDITGDSIQTKTVSQTYRDNYDLIFRKNKQQETIDNDFQDILTTEECVLAALDKINEQKTS